ncbi:MAG: hypothetical protein EOP45_16295 [Sphingobacteriaceae bacterium]|nr:MAG: hypothetical protein EOP45_16295 [Sphingobacteriaceae bacterium]
MESISRLPLNEKLAFINGYLSSIAVLNTTANNGMDHWIIDLGAIEDDLVNTIKKGINAPNWTFKAIEITDWQKVVENECTFFFSNILFEIQGSSDYFSNKERGSNLAEKYNLTAQLKIFIRIIEDLLSTYQLRTAYRIEVDGGSYESDPYFAHGECNFAFEIEVTFVATKSLTRIRFKNTVISFH